MQDIPLNNTAPTNIRLATGEAAVNVSESMAAGQTIARVMADDNGPTSELRYYIAGNPYFVIDELTGEIKLRSDTRLNYEATEGTSHTVTVTVKDLNGVGMTSTHNVVINIDDVNEAATGIDFKSLQAVKARVTLKGADVVLAEATDSDTKAEYRDNLYRFANGTNTDGIFTIDVLTGQITTNRDITSAHVGSYVLKVVAYDLLNPNLAKAVSYTVNVLAADNLAPTITDVVASGKGDLGTAGTDAGKFLIFENEGAGVVADVNAEDGDNDTLTYTLVGTNGDYGGLFSIDVDGKISIADPSTLNWNTDADYELTVQVSDGKGGVVTRDVTVRVKDAITPPNVAPTGLSLVGGSINEYAAPGAEVGTLSATDANGDTLTYTLLDSADGRFAIVGNKLVVGRGVNFEEASTHKVKVQVSDGKGGTAEQVFEVKVTDQWTLDLKGKTKNDKLNGGALDDILNGKKGNDIVKGLAGDDKLYGDVGDDKLYGGLGLDTLWGGKGNDQLRGEDGNDVLYGDEGNDILYGGAGADTFVFTKKANKASNFDQIKDFRSGEDKIFLENKIFKKLGAAGTLEAPAKLDVTMFKAGKAKDKNDFLVYKSGVLYYDANGKAAGGEVEIVKVKGLKATDIFII